MKNRRKILDMLAENKITAEEADRLLSLMGDETEENETAELKDKNPLGKRNFKEKLKNLKLRRGTK